MPGPRKPRSAHRSARRKWVGSAARPARQDRRRKGARAAVHARAAGRPADSRYQYGIGLPAVAAAIAAALAFSTRSSGCVPSVGQIATPAVAHRSAAAPVAACSSRRAAVYASASLVSSATSARNVSRPRYPTWSFARASRRRLRAIASRFGPPGPGSTLTYTTANERFMRRAPWTSSSSRSSVACASGRSAGGEPPRRRRSSSRAQLDAIARATTSDPSPGVRQCSARRSVRRGAMRAT